jgi:hypothetical protein
MHERQRDSEAQYKDLVHKMDSLTDGDFPYTDEEYQQVDQRIRSLHANMLQMGYSESELFALSLVSLSPKTQERVIENYYDSGKNNFPGWEEFYKLFQSDLN